VHDQLVALVNLMIERGVQYQDAVAEFEKRFIKRMLENSGGNQTKAAESLGMHRNTLSRKLEELGLDDRPQRSPRKK